MASHDAPPIAALFRVIFDQKVGYTIAWQRTLPDLDLSGVEFRSLPSGLHGVKKDIVYFVHGDGQYAGISAFAQDVADESHRNAFFCAVGVLVPLNGTQLGKSWLHASGLRELARQQLKHGQDNRVIELYWKNHRADNGTSGQSASPEQSRRSSGAGMKKKRAVSNATEGLHIGDGKATDHPALHMHDFLETFGPLIFPIYRAALSRQRILLLGSPPVQQSCSTVYILSILSSITHAAADALQPDAVDELARTESLFSIGIADMTTLTSRSGANGYVATTTDDILGEKKTLYDLLVELPPASPGSKRRWPRLSTSEGKIIRASQRDLRRYRLLREELRRLGILQSDHHDGAEDALLVETNSATNDVQHDESEIVEPVSWTAAAYNAAIWWASAGANHLDNEAEEELLLEQELLAELPEIHDALSTDNNTTTPTADNNQEGLSSKAETATLLTSYFHRLTTHIITSLASLVDGADDETEAGVSEDAVSVSAEDVRNLSLDPWSESDRVFVAEMVKKWFGRETEVGKAEGWTVCGVRVC
ncbi:hypothetical protein LTR78_001253 [Recurvomyces mirabilis]|uniref:DUF4484 domain-containing protein n=1 Tax=Recurvomyces mirabilis TaxID=574656 RepID=A0AAE0WVF4_9PEZI|nr:hypothetical protein LTR78_001253 [Recurvomyces mirabilis]KAK5161229.1 hypothetical protein LTS14_001025 [Recurvomyces mirabilis]